MDILQGFAAATAKIVIALVIMGLNVMTFGWGVVASTHVLNAKKLSAVDFILALTLGTGFYAFCALALLVLLSIFIGKGGLQTLRAYLVNLFLIGSALLMLVGGLLALYEGRMDASPWNLLVMELFALGCLALALRKPIGRLIQSLRTGPRRDG